MATKTISRLFDTREHALAAVRDLEGAGFSPADIGIAASNEGATTETAAAPVADAETRSGAGAGAALGSIVGGGAGIAAALGALAIPGFGPIVAAGVLAATLTGVGAGAVAGGLVGSLVGMGVSEEEAHVYAGMSAERSQAETRTAHQIGVSEFVHRKEF